MQDNYLNFNLRGNIKDEAETKKTSNKKGYRTRSEPTLFCKLDGYQFNKISNSINGFYAILIENNVYYEGLFKNGERYGPGVLTYLKSMSQNVGWWKCNQILRLCQIVESNWVPMIKTEQDTSIYKSTKTDSYNANNNNIEAIMKTVGICVNTSVRQYMKNKLETHADHKINLEQLLQTENENILIKACKKSLCTEKDTIIFKNFQKQAHNEVMGDILEYTLQNINYELTYERKHIINNARIYFGLYGPNERACIDFLTSCSSGDEVSMKTLKDTYKIQPNLCDGHGNFGLIYASARDRLNIIIYLAKLGANFNVSNDEGLTPLTLVLYRFIATLRGIKNWPSAFMYKATNEFAEEVFSSDGSMVPFIDITFYNKNIAFEYPITNSIFNIFTYYGLHLPITSLQRFQGQYSNNYVESLDNDKFIFDFRIKSSVTKRKNGIPRRISNEIIVRLNVIFNTLVVLLHCGSTPLLDSSPMPALFLGLFTETVDVIKLLLEFGADPSVRLPWYYNITVLHALVSMRSGQYLFDMCKVLLTTKFDLDARTDGNHWWEERSWILGNSKEGSDNGKTALHILAMRKDFYNDVWLPKIAELLITNGASYFSRYLGHVPLTLAMLRGNAVMVNTLLACGASPNESLDLKMGSAINLYLLNRYKDHLPCSEVCLSIMHLLVKYGADPLEKISNGLNTFEFLLQEQSRYISNSHKKCSFKRQTKNACYSDKQRQIQLCILDSARKRIIKHNRCLIFLALYLALKKGVRSLADAQFHLQIAKLMELEHSLKITRYLMHGKVIDLNVESDYNAILRMLLFIKKHGAHKEMRSKKDLLDAMHDLKPLKPCKGLPELDLNFQKYYVCCTCCLAQGKTLLTCPSCGIVKFCSKRCEKRGKKIKLHLCKISFYSDELLQYKFCTSHKIHYEGIHDEYFHKIRKILQNIKFNN